MVERRRENKIRKKGDKKLQLSVINFNNQVVEESMRENKIKEKGDKKTAIKCSRFLKPFLFVIATIM